MALIRLALVTVLSLAFTPVAAQDFQKGLAAVQAGDFATAFQEWTPLAEAGDASAQAYLGALYFAGLGITQDDAEAVRLFRLAADQGDARAQAYLGVMYQFGRGVLQDNVMAYMWLNIATASGSETHVKLRDTVADGMSSEDISKAQAMARKCMNSGYTKCGY